MHFIIVCIGLLTDNRSKLRMLLVCLAVHSHNFHCRDRAEHINSLSLSLSEVGGLISSFFDRALASIEGTNIN